MKLVIMPTTRSRIDSFVEVDLPHEIGTEIVTSRSEEELEKYGQTWAKFWKTDIVMLVE